MPVRLVTDYNEINKNEWIELLSGSTGFSYFQGPEMYRVYAASHLHDPVLVACYDDDILKGILVGSVQKEYKGAIGSLTSRSIIRGGPVVNDNNPRYVEALFDGYEKLISDRAIYTQIRNLAHVPEFIPVTEKYGYAYEDHLEIVADISLTPDQLWKKIHSTRRNGISRAKRAGLAFDIVNTEDGLKESYSILHEVYNRAKLPIPRFAFFLNLLNEAEEHSGLRNFVLKSEGKIIGCMLGLVHNKAIYDYYAGSYSGHYKSFPNDLLPWEVFLWGKDHGCNQFYFGGAGKPGKPYSIRDYKLKFGGETVNFGRFEKIHRPLAFRFSGSAFRIWQYMVKYLRK
jgi:serine/alanine adding enzyme